MTPRIHVLIVEQSTKVIKIMWDYTSTHKQAVKAILQYQIYCKKQPWSYKK